MLFPVIVVSSLASIPSTQFVIVLPLIRFLTPVACTPKELPEITLSTTLQFIEIRIASVEAPVLRLKLLPLTMLESPTMIVFPVLPVSVLCTIVALLPAWMPPAVWPLTQAVFNGALGAHRNAVGVRAGQRSHSINDRTRSGRIDAPRKPLDGAVSHSHAGNAAGHHTVGGATA